MSESYLQGLLSEKENELQAFKEEVRKAVACYMESEGCSCCQDEEAHDNHTTWLAELLNVSGDTTHGFEFYLYSN